jgi:uncharacterized membrane protein (UPF0127 family)
VRKLSNIMQSCQMLHRLNLMLAIGVFLLGCGTRSVNEIEINSAVASLGELTSEQGQVLPIGATVILGGETVELEVTRTPQQQALGLMFRDRLPDNRGMLFTFEPAREVGFWMKNVSIPLDMIFLRDGVIRAIANATPCTSDPCPTYGPLEPIDQVIELRGGRAAELGLNPGDRAIVKFLE